MVGTVMQLGRRVEEVGHKLHRDNYSTLHLLTYSTTSTTGYLLALALLGITEGRPPSKFWPQDSQKEEM
jgi:hypothetical protein